MFDEESKEIFANSIDIWNKTEVILKQSEQFSDQLVIPAVTELRYAGRKLVDFTWSRLNNEPIEISRKHIFDYEQCCIRARHDAVDAVVMYMKSYYNHMIREFGIDVVNESYRRLAELKKVITIVDQRILISRDERYKRSELYTEINDNSLTSLIELFSGLVDSTEIVKGIRERRDRQHRVGVLAMYFGAVAIPLAILAIIVSVYLWRHPYVAYDTTPPPSANTPSTGG